MVRVLRRSWIVEDLGSSLSALDRNLDWQPRVGPEIDAAIGCRRAVFGFAHPRSAELELLEPIAAGEVKESLDAWGPGSWTIRIGVNDIEAKADGSPAAGYDIRDAHAAGRRQTRAARRHRSARRSRSLRIRGGLNEAMYQLMTTVSVLVDDIHSGVETLCRTIGIPEPRPQSYRSGPGIDAVFCRVHVKYAVAPTFLELVAPGGGEASADYPLFPVTQIAARQGKRAIKWHATELSMTEETFVDLARHLERLGVPHGFMPPDRRERFFLGGDPATTYDWNADAGLVIEAGRSGHLGLPEEAFHAPADIPPDSQPDTMLRIVAREYLVENLDETLRILERNLRWTPVSVTDEDGCRRAVMAFSVPRSARLELVQPTRSGRVADAYAELGPGAWTVRVSVVDVDAKAKDLAARGTPFTFDDGVLRADPAVTLNVPFEFVAGASTTREAAT